MLNVKHRLKKRKSFAYIHRRGRHIGNDVLSMVYVDAKSKTAKIGFSVSKKVGNSVVRHRAIRKMRHSLREIIATVPANYNAIFIAKENIHNRHNDEIVRAMQNCIARSQKAGINSAKSAATK